MSAGTCTCPSADGTTRTRRRTSVPAICKLYDELWLDRSTPELMPSEVVLVKRSSPRLFARASASVRAGVKATAAKWVDSARKGTGASMCADGDGAPRPGAYRPGAGR